jgi:hypothetical protein
LTEDYGGGYSVDNLEAFRQFYLKYPRLIAETTPRNAVSPAISETLSRNFSSGDDAPFWEPGLLHTNLSSSHYRALLRVDREEARAFYEIKAISNGWSVRELSWQTASLLFERLARSRDKEGLLRLATRGQEVAQPVDVFKDPTVIEFLGLPESPRLV